MGETERLIKAVEKYPCIWNFDDDQYHNRNAKDFAWEQIGFEVYRDWKTCTNQVIRCVALKKKWGNIKDYYRKELKRREKAATGRATKRSRAYVYEDLLEFLLPIFSKKDIEETYLIRDSDNVQPQLKYENDSVESEDDSHTEPDFCIPKKKRGDSTRVSNISPQRGKMIATTSYIGEDDDTKFLLSFRSYMKNMNSNQKIDFELGMLQLVKNIMTNSPGPKARARKQKPETPVLNEDIGEMEE